MLECFRPDAVEQGTVFTLLVALGVSGVTLWLRKQDEFFGKRYFLAALIAMELWLLGSMMELSQLNLHCRVFWASAVWPMIVFLPTAWSFFIMEYCLPSTAGRYGRLKALFLWGAPFLVLLIVATNPMHRLFYGPATRLIQNGSHVTVIYDHGPLFFLAAGYLYLFLGYAFVQTLAGTFHAQRRFRLFFAGLFIITAIPAVANLSYIAFGVTIYGFDPTPYAFSAVLSVLAWMIVNNRLMDTDVMVRDVLFYSVPDPVLLIGPKGNILTANPEARRLLGEGEPQARRADHIPEQVPHWLEPVARAVIAEKFIEDVEPLKVAGREFSLTVAPLPRPINDEGVPIGWVLRMHDMTQRLQLQRALDAQRDVQVAMAETSLAGLIVLDATGVFVFANAEAERILGIRLADGRRFAHDDPEWDIRLSDGQINPDLEQILHNFPTEGGFLREQRLSLCRRSDGERRILALNVTPLSLAGMPRARALLSLVDITDQYRYETELKDAAARAEAANRAKSQFLANMSHEIRTPLNGVLGMADVLSRSVRGAEQKRMVETIRESGELLLSLLNEILDMAKIEAGKMRLEELRFEPQAIAESIDALFWPQADAKGLSLNVLLPRDRLAPRIGDALRLRQVLQNLVGNAIKFTAEGEVRLQMSETPEGALVVEIADTGIGMTPEQVSRVFDEFEQADGSTTRRFGGTGLGMSIVRRLVDAMAGEIAIDSRPGEGTLIRLVLPLPKAEGADGPEGQAG